MDDEYWKSVQERDFSPMSGRTGVVNIALLFGTAAVAFALILPPMLGGSPDKKSLAFEADQYDDIVTGSIGDSSDKGKKTVYHSSQRAAGDTRLGMHRRRV